MLLLEKGGFADVDVELDMNVVGLLQMVKVVNALLGKVVIMASPVSCATLEQSGDRPSVGIRY